MDAQKREEMYVDFIIIIGRNFGNVKILIPVIHERNFSFNFINLKIVYCCYEPAGNKRSLPKIIK